jgi:hypothetical protein
VSLKWIESPEPNHLGWTEWLFVEEESGEVQASVKQYGHKANWNVASHGALFGEFLTKEQAMKRAEEVAPKRVKR